MNADLKKDEVDILEEINEEMGMTEVDPKEKMAHDLIDQNEFNKRLIHLKEKNVLMWKRYQDRNI